MLLVPSLAVAAVLLIGCGAANDSDPERIVRPTAPASTSTPAAPATPSAAPPSAPASSTPAPAPVPGTGPECIEGTLTIRGAGLDVDFAGECARVDIEGTDLDVDLSEARIDGVVVRGDRNEVDLGGVGSLEVTGQSSEVDVDAIGALTVSGDRNVVDSEGDIGSVRVSGNDNRVEGRTLGPVEQSGDRNEVVAD